MKAILTSAILFLVSFHNTTADIVKLRVEGPIEAILPVVSKRSDQVVMLHRSGKSVLFFERGDDVLGEIQTNKLLKITEVREHNGDAKTILKMKELLSSRNKWWMVTSTILPAQNQTFELTPSPSSKIKSYSIFFPQEPRALNDAGAHSVEEFGSIIKARP